MTMPDPARPSTGTAASPTSQAVIDDLRAFEEQVGTTIQRKRLGRDINELYDESLTLGERIADRVAAAVGSWPFIIVQSIFLAGWIVLNVTELIWRAWDPYPFILLNLVLSL